MDEAQRSSARHGASECPPEAFQQSFQSVPAAFPAAGENAGCTFSKAG